jgi:hypothetical protein
MNSPMTRQVYQRPPALEAQFHIFRRIAVGNKRAIEVQKKANVSGVAYPLGNLFPMIEKVRDAASSLSHINRNQQFPMDSGRFVSRGDACVSEIWLDTQHGSPGFHHFRRSNANL